jgi:hypothetical protein
MNKPQSNNPRARLQALLAIPDRQRSDEEWDELNELEIMLAAGNRESNPGQQQGGRREGGGQSSGQQRSDGMPQQGRPPGSRPHNRPPKRKGR